MRDYVSYFTEQTHRDKCGVSVHRDIDWWVEYFAARMAKLIFIILLLGVFLLVKSFWQIGNSQYAFPIERVVLEGDILITQEKDIAAILDDMQSNSFFEVDLQQLSDKLVALPWIEKVSIKRQWPNKLAVTVVEREVSYRWGDNELLDREGNRFAKTNHVVFEQLPRIDGVSGYESEVIVAYQQLIKELGGSAERLGIEKFVLNAYLSWELHLQSGLVVKFGRDDYTQRLKRFVQAYQSDKLPNAEQLTTIDFRYHRGFAVKWKSAFLPQPQLGTGQLMKAAQTEI